MTVRFGVLGPLEVWSDGETIPIRGAKRRGLLAYLLARAGEPQPPDRIVDAVWGETASSSSEATVQTYVSQLRRLFSEEGPRVERRAGGYVLDLDANALDAARFEAAIAAATAVPDREERLSLLDGALALWRGAPLDEFAGQPWADERARQWTRMHVLAHQLRAAALLDAGRHRDALPTLEQLVTAHPLHEPFWAQLVVARYRCDQQADALAALSEARKVLATELGIEPGSALVELEAKVLSRDSSLDAHARDIDRRDNDPVTTVVEALPDGVVTFLLTDIERSTELWDRHSEGMAKALVRHEDVIAELVHTHYGRLLKSRGEGDATLSVFAKATDAVAAAVSLQRRLGIEAWPDGLELRTRVALHTGEAQLRNGDYYGGTLNRAAHVRGLATGGEVLLSNATHDVVVELIADELELVPVGEHAMRGLRRHENVFAVRAPGLEPNVPKAAAMMRARPLGGMVGRADIIERIQDALQGSGIVTLTGPGGIGKTRLLEEACMRFADQFERVWLIDLAAARDAAAVESALQHAILPRHNTVLEARRVPDRTDVITQLAERLVGRRTLVALDNCEQLLDFLPQMVSALLQRSPNLTVLTTSREAFASAGELIIPIAPLTLPSADAERIPELLRHVESVELLVRRVSEAGGGLDVTAETAADIASVCRQLDGIPLAVELAAARLQSTSVQDLAARLPRQLELLSGRGADPRHRTLRNAIDWSYALLEPPQQLLLRRLGIFMGGFTLNAAEEVCSGERNDQLSSGDAVYLNLAELVSKSLVVFDRNRSRYRLLEPIRQFARQLLEISDEFDSVAELHARWALRHSRATAARLSGEGSMEKPFRYELDNIHAALDWLHEHDPTTFMRIVAALGYMWFQTDWRRGRVEAERAVKLARDAKDRLRAAVLFSRGLVEQRADLESSAQWLEEALGTMIAVDDEQGAAWAVFFLAFAYSATDVAKTQDLFADARLRFRKLGLRTGEAWAVADLGAAAQDRGELDFGRECMEQAIVLAREANQSSIIGTALVGLSRNAVARGDFETAREQIHEAVELQQNAGDQWNQVDTLSKAAWIEILTNHLDEAQVFLCRALNACLEIDDEWHLREVLVVLAALRLKRGDFPGARSTLAATGWDTNPPERAVSGRHSVLAAILEELKPLLAHEYDDFAAAGRSRSVFATARLALESFGEASRGS